MDLGHKTSASAVATNTDSITYLHRMYLCGKTFVVALSHYSKVSTDGLPEDQRGAENIDRPIFKPYSFGQAFVYSL